MASNHIEVVDQTAYEINCTPVQRWVKWTQGLAPGNTNQTVQKQIIPRALLLIRHHVGHGKLVEVD